MDLTDKQKYALAFIALDEPILRSVVRHHDAFDAVFSAENITQRETERLVDFRQATLIEKDEIQFHSNFQMKHNTFRILLDTISPALPKPYDGFGKKVIPPHERLSIFLWFLSSTETYRQLAARFDTTDSVVHETVEICLNAVMERLDEIKFPSTKEQCAEIAVKFHLRNNYPGAVGAIGGTYIEILKPGEQPDVKTDLKGQHCINCAAVVDADGRFIAASLGSPGLFHDGKVFRVSDLNDKISNLPDNYHVLGDWDHGLQGHILVPYKDDGNLTRKQKTFNSKHSSNRAIVESTFDKMKMKFSRLQAKLVVHSWRKTVLIVQASMQLHNLIQRLENTNAEHPEYEQVQLPQDPKHRRDAIADMIY